LNKLQQTLKLGSFLLHLFIQKLNHGHSLTVGAASCDVLVSVPYCLCAVVCTQ
jgi:hypothetical protein